MSPEPREPMHGAAMEAALNLEPQTPTRGDERLLDHIRSLAAEEREPAQVRLERALGPELAGLLVAALVPAVQGRRASSSP